MVVEAVEVWYWRRYGGEKQWRWQRRWMHFGSGGKSLVAETAAEATVVAVKVWWWRYGVGGGGMAMEAMALVEVWRQWR